MKQTTIRTLIRILALTFGVLLLAATPRADAQTNILSNPGFEEPYSGGVAGDWFPWHQEANAELSCDTNTILHRPAWSPEIVGGNGGELILEGSRSQHVGNQFATWHGGVAQNVTVTPGVRYQFSSHFWARASQENYSAPSDQGVNIVARVGIDPTGAGLWSSPNIIWGSSVNPHQAWQQAVVEATATGSTITVLVAANFGGPGQCRAHLDAWFDNASLTSTTPPPTNTPAATNTPQVWPTRTPTPITPTATPVPTETPIPPTSTPTETPTITPTPLPTGPWFTPTPLPATPVPTQPPVVFVPTLPPAVEATAVPPTEVPAEGEAEEAAAPTDAEASSEDAPTDEEASEPEPTAIPPTNTPAPPTGGTICVNTFSDENANGLRDDPEEGYMAGITILIGQNGAIVNQGISTGTDTPVCFEELDPGEYEVAQRLSNRLEMTTAGNALIPVEQGRVIGLEFGSRIAKIPDPTATTPDESAEADTTQSAVADQAAATASESQANATDSGALAMADDGVSDNRPQLIGLGALGAAVVLLGAVLIALLRR